MTKAKVLEEIQAVNTSVLNDGLSFTGSFETTGRLTAIEQLLFYCNCRKYYYNYTEKRLRKLESNLDNIIKSGPDNVIFVCKDQEDDTEIEIDAQTFASKIICYEDFHKVITYDEDTKNYECFFIALSEKKVNEFFETAREHLPEELKDLIHKPENKKDILNDESPVVLDAFKTLCDYLNANAGELSEIRFTNIGDGIKIDLIASKFYPTDNETGSPVL